MAEKSVTEPYYDVVYRDYNNEIQKKKIEADNVFIDGDKVSFTVNRVTTVRLTGVLEAWRVPQFEE